MSQCRKEKNPSGTEKREVKFISSYVELNKDENKAESTNNEILFTIFGKHDFLDDEGYPILNEESKFTYAKKKRSPTKQGWKFYIRLNQYGRLFDPIGMYDQHNENRTAMRGAAKPTYKEVNLKTFNNYLNYLKTKNKAHFLNAERGN